MASIKLSISVAETPKQLGASVRKAVAVELNKIFKSAAGPILRKTRSLLRLALEDSPAVESLMSGKLKLHLGIPDPERKFNAIVEQWIKSVKVTFSPIRVSGGKLIGGLTIQAIKKNWADVLSVPEAQQMTKKGQSLPWLDWLLLQGDKTIIKEFEIVTGKGRAGRLIMRAKEKGKWSIPPEFAGTMSNNFITRALVDIGPKLETVIIYEINRKL